MTHVPPADGGLQEAKKRTEEQTKAEEANMQDVSAQVQKLMAEIEVRAIAKKDEVGLCGGTADGHVESTSVKVMTRVVLLG